MTINKPQNSHENKGVGGSPQNLRQQVTEREREGKRVLVVVCACGVGGFHIHYPFFFLKQSKNSQGQ